MAHFPQLRIMLLCNELPQTSIFASDFMQRSLVKVRKGYHLNGAHILKPKHFKKEHTHVANQLLYCALLYRVWPNSRCEFMKYV